MPAVMVSPKGGTVSEAPAETLRRAAKLILETARTYLGEEAA